MKTAEERFSIARIVQAWNNRSLAPNPDYQRGEEWKIHQQQALIDSVFRDYPIPPIFLEQKAIEGLRGSSGERFEVVDGQQRLLALASYLRDEFPLLEPQDRRLRLPTSLRGRPALWAGRTYSQLGHELRTKLDSTELVAYIVSDVGHPDEVRDLFIRLQSGTALSRQQIRDAWPGHMGPYVEKLAGKLKRRPKYEFFQVVDRRGTRWDEASARDPFVSHRQTCAQLLRLLLERTRFSVPRISANDLDAFYHDNTDLDIESPSIKAVEDVFDLLDILCATDRYNSNRRSVPKIVLFSAAMFIQDLMRVSDYKPDPWHKNMHRLAEYVFKERPRPEGRPTSASAINAYYESWLQNLRPEMFGVELDPKRCFDDDQKRQLWQAADGTCQICGEPVMESEAEYDHFPIPHRVGGKTVIENGRLVHERCHPRGRPTSSS